VDNKLVWLGEAACQQNTLTGNKAANLSRLATNYRVPPGFCLTTAAFAGVSPDDDAGLPPALQTSLAAAYQEMALRCQQATPAVAVRSSAVGEDGFAASFAGQYTTYLNIVGDAALQQAVVRCWASARGGQVNAYRQHRGQQPRPMAVLVQQLIAADVAVVAFSMHPVTGKRTELVINATWGLGESLVSGTVTPDSYTVRKADGIITQHAIGDKTHMTVLAPDGVCEAPVPLSRQRRLALTAEQISEVAALAQTLELELGWPVDIECAYQSGKLFLLQCRPITGVN
jgi:pyruvate,water dikinase